MIFYTYIKLLKNRFKYRIFPLVNYIYINDYNIAIRKYIYIFYISDHMQVVLI